MRNNLNVLFVMPAANDLIEKELLIHTTHEVITLSSPLLVSERHTDQALNRFNLVLSKTA